ncbi:hypothetical protein BDP27DRAFT_1324584 [Rhodocollybia butyracea]|uniref:Uncharacterized protein n=1 Tax=Rhodocollybia butyracea TaxID=206335 RepID=A0A9P5PVF0_9AGAR|nr:hypothetical protein BDP27DRAFT_1324584 [Rhodocollybia butyracea]
MLLAVVKFASIILTTLISGEALVASTPLDSRSLASSLEVPPGFFDGTNSGQALWEAADGVGACGTEIENNAEFIGYVNQMLFNSVPGYNKTIESPQDNPVCGQLMSVTYEGITIQVTVEDMDIFAESPAGIGLSSAAFGTLTGNNFGLGIIDVTWEWAK